MQFQRALTVGKLLLGHNLVNLCSLRILPYLTQPDTVTQECGPSLWPLVRRSPRVSGHSGEAAPASLRPRRASRCSHPTPRAAGGSRARGSPPPRSPGRRPGSAPGRSVSDGGASVRPGPPRRAPRLQGRRRFGSSLLRAPRSWALRRWFPSRRGPETARHRHLWVPPQGPGPAGSLRRWLEALSGPAGRSRRSVCQGRRGAPRACAEGPGRAAVSLRGGELGPAVGRSQSRTQGRGSWPGRRPGKAAAGCVC